MDVWSVAVTGNGVAVVLVDGAGLNVNDSEGAAAGTVAVAKR